LLFYANNKLHLNCTLEIPFTSETITILSEKTGFREKNKFHKRHISLVLLFCSLAYMINGPDTALNKQLPENQMNFRINVREYLRNDDDMMQWSENKSDQLIDNSPSLDSRLRERAVEIGSRLKLVADQMDKDRRGTIKTVVEQYWAADWLETRDAVSGQQWSTFGLARVGEQVSPIVAGTTASTRLIGVEKENCPIDTLDVQRNQEGAWPRRAKAIMLVDALANCR
ncbi:hypothetical protein T12_8542, partial [Trichinella patagoniensis]